MRISHSTPSGEKKFEHEIPQFGLGVFLMSEEGECKSSVLTALEAGYTHIDTARAYNNEHEVGEAIKESGMDRDSLFITTKLRRMHATGYEESNRALQRNLLSYSTLVISTFILSMPRLKIQITEARLERNGVLSRTRLGQINWSLKLRASTPRGDDEYASYMPSVNQVEFNPWLQRPTFVQGYRRRWCKGDGVFSSCKRA